MAVKTNNYVKKSGDTMSGTLTMGATAAWDPATGNITTTGTVDGIDVSAHDIATTGVHGVGASTILSAATAASTYLPLAGGTMSGTLIAPRVQYTQYDNSIARSVDNSYLNISGASTAANGAGIYLCGGDHATIPGNFYVDYGDYRAGYAIDSKVIFRYGTNTVQTTTLTIDKTGVITTIGSVIIMANAAKTSVLTPPQYTTENAPTSTAGNVYFDTTLNKLRIRGAAGWETVTSV